MHALRAFRDASKSRPRPISTALENLRDWDADSSNAYSRFSAPKPLHEETTESTCIAAADRPALKSGDRHDWSQESQCGDSARHSLHLFRKKDSAREEAELAGLRAGMRSSNSRQGARGGSPDRLVSDAVKLIKEERRRSVFNLFRWI